LTIRSPETKSDYDEFGFVDEIASELGLPRKDAPRIARREVQTGAGLMSAIMWGDSSPELVFLHGGGQNAHTWDAVALAMGRPAVAIDLPGHGHSYWRADRDYMPWKNAEALEIGDAAIGAGCQSGDRHVPGRRNNDPARSHAS
jgi:pimeloyl-ACP methyl ester carboxylesterase